MLKNCATKIDYMFKLIDCRLMVINVYQLGECHSVHLMRYSVTGSYVLDGCGLLGGKTITI